jgi:hypothetical protein
MKPPPVVIRKSDSTEGWKTVHFKIEGAFVMNIARNLWAEGEEIKGLKLLVEGLHGMTEGLALEILTGKQKLVGWDSEIRMEPDNATKDNRGIPLPQSFVEVIRNKEKRFEKEKEEHDSLADEVVRRVDAIEDACLESESPGKNLLVDMESLMGPPRPHIKDPKPTTEFIKWDCGWLSPSGDFYGCHYAEHISLSHTLEDKIGFKRPAVGDIDRIGWIKLQCDDWMNPFRFLEEGGVVTQSQITTLFDWHTAKKKELSDWMK